MPISIYFKLCRIPRSVALTCSIYLIMLRYLSLLLLLLMAWQTPARADWINLTGAETAPNIVEIYVLDDHVRLVLEVYIGDLDTFSELVPDNLLKDTSGRPSLEQRLQSFSKNTFQFVTDSGEQLSAELAVVEPRLRVDRQSPFAGMINPITRQRVPEPPADKRVLYAELRYPFSKQPQTLTIIPPRDEKGIATKTIGFIAYHKSVPIIDFRYLGQAAKLNLDWQDPWYSKFDNPNLKRHHKSALMTFLYVEPYEVRHEILCRIKDLEDWIDFDYQLDDVITVDDQEEIKKRIGDFLIHRNVVRIDGEARNPILDRIHFVEVSLAGITVQEIPKPMPYASAIVGIIFAYPDKGMPKEITMQWDMFNEKIQRIPCVSEDPAGPWPYDLQPSDSVLKWTNFLKHYKLPTVSEQKIQAATFHLPILSLIFVLTAVFMLFRNRWTLSGFSKGRKFLFSLLVILSIFSYPIGNEYNLPFLSKKISSEPEAEKILFQLLKNTYRAFDFRKESDIYDKLAISNDQDLLQEIYLQTRNSMAIEEQGGIEAKVEEVVIKSVKEHQNSSRDYSYRCQWIVRGEIGHWGHNHQRINQYDAIIDIKPIDGENTYNQ